MASVQPEAGGLQRRLGPIDAAAIVISNVIGGGIFFVPVIVAQLVPRPAFSFAATPPFGIPQLWSLAFWGAVWGVVLAIALARLDGARLIVAALIFGAVFPTLVAWFVVAPLKGQPVAAGWAPAAMAIGPIVNAAWGLGTGIGLYLFGRPR